MVWFGDQRGENLLDGGAHFYDTYETSDGLFMAVGALEPQFYSQLLIGLGLDINNEEHSQLNMIEMKTKFEHIFKTKTQQEWTNIFENLDACCTPVLAWNKAHQYEHNQQRKNFSFTNLPKKKLVPMPAPRFSSSTLPSIDRPPPFSGQHTIEILQEIGFAKEHIEQLLDKNIVQHVEQVKSNL
jgi:alpha-methylacyl-CoA racemase